MRKVLLYSGGLDSWLIARLWKPDVLLYVDMGTKYSKEEIARLSFNCIKTKLDLSQQELPDGIIPMRNLYLVGIASKYGEDICLGATAGDRVLDKSETFADKASELLSYLWSPQHWTSGKKVKVGLYYKMYTKTELLKMYLDKGGDVNVAFTSSFSCYNPVAGQPCWVCKPCIRKWAAFRNNGYTHPCAAPHAIKKLLALPNAGGRGREDEELLKSIEE